MCWKLSMSKLSIYTQSVTPLGKSHLSDLGFQWKPSKCLCKERAGIFYGILFLLKQCFNRKILAISASWKAGSHRIATVPLCSRAVMPKPLPFLLFQDTRRNPSLWLFTIWGWSEHWVFSVWWEGNREEQKSTGGFPVTALVLSREDIPTIPKQ